MGRMQFSQSYVSSAPAIRTEPEPQVDLCDRYSSINRFDPDSEDFFRDAEYEAFIDPVTLLSSEASSPLNNNTVVYSDSSEASSDNGADSPMATATETAPLTDGARTDIAAQWQLLQQELDSADSEWRSTTTDRATYTSSIDFGASSTTGEIEEIPIFIPPASYRASSPAIGNIRITVPSQRHTSPTRRVVNITPIRVSSRSPSTRSPSPESPAPPSTPPPHSSARPLLSPQTLLTPSPPPTVSPRFYSWQSHPIPAMPVSPTLMRNHRARRSLARIDTAAPRIEAPVM
ncbi:hypothetical protein CVT24_003585 [Panaeolus cyanescens]|uniref:Uncharacterized protein n=1 Tax=Panaeolus cyanescens TaxID=181874 RepID=A0A409Y7M9_9AGAR|nr:hypothetical protein CVT24_003585 [Panaeolus cyanescens]